MRITVQELFNVGKLFGDLVDKEMPIEAALKLRRINKAVGEEIEIYDPERLKIFQNVKCPMNGNNFDVEKLMKESPEKFKELDKKLVEFYKKEIDLKCKPLKVSELGSIDIKPSALILLEKFIED